jgi:hypothetical protein
LIFNVGDRVKVYKPFTQDDWTFSIGESGTIRRVTDECGSPSLGIEWDFEGFCFHTCAGMIKDKYGYYIYPTNYEYLRRIPKKIGNIGEF